MRIGIVTTWFERGASYVSRIYRDLLVKEGHEVFVYARGGEFAKLDNNWDKSYVTWGKELPFTYINKSHIFSWIKRYKIETIFFNEQHEFSIVVKIREKYPNLKLGSYIDYYTEETIPFFDIYDFVICNTLRHKTAFHKHKQSYYIKWGTDVDLFHPIETKKEDKVTFFHSMGMSYRKGTDSLIRCFIKSKIYKKSRLIIHTQLPKSEVCKLSEKELREYNIEIISKTVTAPGLYHLGDVYVYPTTLEGLGLTIYEALSCGLPVIVTDYPPMNEVIHDDVGILVNTKEIHSRKDGYYWPLAYSDSDSLIDAMKQFLYMDSNELKRKKHMARTYALNELNIKKRSKEISNIFVNSKIIPSNKRLNNRILIIEKQKRKRDLFNVIASGNIVVHLLWKIIK